MNTFSVFTGTWLPPDHLELYAQLQYAFIQCLWADERNRMKPFMPRPVSDAFITPDKEVVDWMRLV